MIQKAGKFVRNLNWRLSALFLLLVGALLLQSGVASAKPRAAKGRTAKVAASKRTVGVKRTVSASARKSKRRSTRRTRTVRGARVAAPVAPAAELPLVTEPAAAWHGCLNTSELSELASRLQLDEDRLASVLTERELLPSSESRSCLPYAGASGGEGGAATALFYAPKPSAVDDAPPSSPSVLVVSRTADDVTVAGREFRSPGTPERVVSFPATEFATRKAELLTDVSEPVQWQIQVLVPRMIPEEGDATVRIGLGRSAETGREYLHSLEIFDAASGRLLDGAWWMERPSGPGALVGLRGAAYERMLWLAPIDFLRKSRGPGPSSRLVRRNFAARNGKRATRRVAVRAFHMGVDLTAPKGTPIHSVAGGIISFSGWRGGYGNLVIVDHGLGYQTYYAHLSSFQPGMTAGATVERGEVIGLVGSTGRSTAPHLHFETRKDSRYIDTYDESRELEFWQLSPEEHEELAMRLLAVTPSAIVPASGGEE
jgi:murein DD-endopeptidase MepM/ murein hydrolase activator NlpD